MWIWQHCGRRRRSKRIARPGRRWWKSSSWGRCRLPACRGRPPKALRRSRAGWSPNSPGRIARSSPSRDAWRPPPQSRRIQQHHSRSAGRRHPSRRQFSGGRGGLRFRQHQRRAESVARAARKIRRCRRARGADRPVRAGTNEARRDALLRARAHQRYARQLFAAQGSLPLRRDGLEHAPFRALHPPFSGRCRVQLSPGVQRPSPEPVRAGASGVLHRRQADSRVRGGCHGSGRPDRRMPRARHCRRAPALRHLSAKLPRPAAQV